MNELFLIIAIMGPPQSADSVLYLQKKCETIVQQAQCQELIERTRNEVEYLEIPSTHYHISLETLDEGAVQQYTEVVDGEVTRHEVIE